MYRKYFIIFVVVLLLGLNIPYLVSFSKNIIGENLFKQKEYSKSFDTFPDTLIGYYNKGNSLYKLGKYDKAIKTYFSILQTGNNELNFRLNHNLGNSYYRYGESKKSNSEKKFYWEKTVSYYRNALKIKYDEQTKKNLEFVLKKLNELNSKKNQDNKKTNSKNSQNKSGNKQKNQDNKKQDTGKNSKNKEGQQKQSKEGNGGKKTSNNSKSGGQGKKTNQKGQNKKSAEAMKKNEEKKQLEAAKKAGLNEQQYKALKEYQKKIKNEQKNNMNYYGKVYQEPQQDPFFGNSIDQGNNVKDW